MGLTVRYAHKRLRMYVSAIKLKTFSLIYSWFKKCWPTYLNSSHYSSTSIYTTHTITHTLDLPFISYTYHISQQGACSTRGLLGKEYRGQLAFRRTWRPHTHAPGEAQDLRRHFSFRQSVFDFLFCVLFCQTLGGMVRHSSAAVVSCLKPGVA